MIDILHANGGRCAVLACDRCGIELFGRLTLGARDWPTKTQVRTLRERAQAAGWMHVLVSIDIRQPSDLCPSCFTLPPEA